MEKLTEAQLDWLERIDCNGGTWPDRPFLRNQEDSLFLMRTGLVELHQPKAPFLPFVAITPAGRAALADGLCDDCPPVGYLTDKTRCLPCPRRRAQETQ